MNATDQARLSQLFDRDIDESGRLLPLADELERMFMNDGLNDAMDRALATPFPTFGTIQRLFGWMYH